MSKTRKNIAAPPPGRPTLKTIAFMTGLGVTTVSRALKDAPDIGEDTKKRVRLIADQIGYRPNRAGVRLRTGKTNVISLILNTEEEIMGLTTHIIHGISAVLEETPYHLVVTPYNHDSDPMDPVRYVVETGSADGVILSRTELDDARVRYLTDKRMPFATHGRTDMGIEHAFHDSDNWAYAWDAVHILSTLGRQKVALLSPPSNLTYAKFMANGFYDAATHYQLQQKDLGAITVDDTTEIIAAHIYQVMRSADRPDGIVCSSAGAAIGVTAGLERAGLALGEDVDIVTKQSAFNFMQWFRPALHLIDEDFRLAGRDLARQVIALINGDAPSDHQAVVYQGPRAFMEVTGAGQMPHATK